MPVVNFASNYYSRIFLQSQTDFRTIPASGGAWNSSGAQMVRAMSGTIQMAKTDSRVKAQWVHGSRSQLPEYVGRRGATWGVTIPLAPSGSPGVPPDCDIMLQGIFGGAPTVQAGVSSTYNIYDTTIVPFGMYQFNHGDSTVGNRYIFGCLPQTANFTFNSDLFEIQASGVGVAAVQDAEFPVADSVAKGGLTSFPTEPSSFSLIGQIIPGYQGVLTLDGNVISRQCYRFSVSFRTGFDYLGSMIDDAYPAQPIRALRVVSVDVAMMNSDSSALIDLKQKAVNATPINGSFVLGTASGYIVTASFSGLQLKPSAISDQTGYVECSFGSAEGSVSPGSSNEFSLSFS